MRRVDFPPSTLVDDATRSCQRHIYQEVGVCSGLLAVLRNTKLWKFTAHSGLERLAVRAANAEARPRL